MDVKIGSSPNSWGIWFPQDDKQLPWQRFLDEIAEAGYEWTEFGPYGYLPTDPDQLKKELDSRGLQLAGNWAMDGNLANPKSWPSLEQQVLNVGELLNQFNGKFIILIDGMYTDLKTAEQLEAAEWDDEGWKRAIETTYKLAQLSRDRFGLDLVFHPHAQTRVQFENQVERFLEETDENLVGLCLDTGHYAYCGGDPVALMQKYHQRTPYLHLKSVRADVQKKVLDENIPFANAVDMGMFCEPSEGAVNFLALRDVLREVNWSGWAIVEQDMYPAPPDQPLAIAKRTREYLRAIGIG